MRSRTFGDGARHGGSLGNSIALLNSLDTPISMNDRNRNIIVLTFVFPSAILLHVTVKSVRKQWEILFEIIIALPNYILHSLDQVLISTRSSLQSKVALGCKVV